MSFSLSPVYSLSPFHYPGLLFFLPTFDSLHPTPPSLPPSLSLYFSHAPPRLSSHGEDRAMRCNYSNWLWLLHLHDKCAAVLGTNGLLSAPFTTALVWSGRDRAPVGWRGVLWGAVEGDKGVLALDGLGGPPYGPRGLEVLDPWVWVVWEGSLF